MVWLKCIFIVLYNKWFDLDKKYNFLYVYFQLFNPLGMFSVILNYILLGLS